MNRFWRGRRIPLSWLLLTRQPVRLLVALAGISFAGILMFMQLGFRDGLFDASVTVHRLFDADIVLISPRSTSSVFHIPHDIGNEINSTWGYINVSEGGFLPTLNEPSGFIIDTTLDSAASNVNLYNSGTISVGRSVLNTAASQRSSFIVSVDLTKLPINGTYEIMDAFVTLNTKSTSYGEVFWSPSLINTAFDGDANWNNATNTTQWNTPGAYHSTDTDIPYSGSEEIFWDDPYQTGDITGLLQQAVANGATSLDFLIQAEENDSSVDGRIDMYSSNELSADLRPSLNITYRMTNPYVASSPTGLMPVADYIIVRMSDILTETYPVYDINEHWAVTLGAAQTMQRVLSISTDIQEVASFFMPDFSTWDWDAREIEEAKKLWGIK